MKLLNQVSERKNGHDFGHIAYGLLMMNLKIANVEAAPTAAPPAAPPTPMPTAAPVDTPEPDYI